MGNEETQAIVSFKVNSGKRIRDHIVDSIQQYFERLNETPITNLYDMVLKEIEEPLLKNVMEYVKGNQSKAAVLLGLSRGTFRTKLVRYGMLKCSKGKGSKGSKN